MLSPAPISAPIEPQLPRLPAEVIAACTSDAALLALAAANRDLRIERTAQGALVIMPPAGAETGYRNSQLTAALTVWANADKRGLAFDSSAGFRLPNGAVRAADAAWLRRERWEALTTEQRRAYAPLCPDFVIELKSPSDSLKETQNKLEEFLENGAQLGWLIDPDEHRVHVYQPGKRPVVLDAPTEVDGDPVLPGFVLSLELIS